MKNIFNNDGIYVLNLTYIYVKAKMFYLLLFLVLSNLMRVQESDIESKNDIIKYLNIQL